MSNGKNPAVIFCTVLFIIYMIYAMYFTAVVLGSSNPNKWALVSVTCPLTDLRKCPKNM